VLFSLLGKNCQIAIAEAFVLVQMRTQKIGLHGYLKFLIRLIALIIYSAAVNRLTRQCVTLLKTISSSKIPDLYT